MSDKYNKLVKFLKDKGKVCIGFSGGVDSTFLLSVAKKVLGDNVLAVTALSSMNPEREKNEGVNFCKSIEAKHILIEADEYSIPEFVLNNKERCYFCKKSIFTKIKEIAKSEGYDVVLDGSNVDDDSDYRPGMRAIKELGIISPLKEANLTKSEIRELCKEMGLKVWNKPSMACLASRIPYGSIITKEKLKKVELAEEVLFSKGFKQFRVRYYDNLAKIEVPNDEIHKIITISKEIIEEFKKIGFTYITIDLEGFRSGSMNEVLNI